MIRPLLPIRRPGSTPSSVALRQLPARSGNGPGIEPEQVIVLETIGETVDGLAQAAAKVPGLEWLAEFDMEDAEPFGGFQDAKDPSKKLTCRLYAVMSNQQAMSQLLALWNDWTVNPHKDATRGFGPFKNVFIHLKDVRRWSPQDRLEHTGVLEYWQEYLQHKQERICPF